MCPRLHTADKTPGQQLRKPALCALAAGVTNARLSGGLTSPLRHLCVPTGYPRYPNAHCRIRLCRVEAMVAAGLIGIVVVVHSRKRRSV